MRYGIIDVGSNTIRGVAYETEGNRAVKVEDKLVKSHILDSIENNSLNKSGLELLIVVLNKLRELLFAADCKVVHCFATASLRGLDNIEDIKRNVYETTGIIVDVLSGDEEAECDFIALRSSIPERSAIGIDLGGGSCQLMQFERDKLLYSNSFDIGSRRLKNRFVSGRLPTAQERKDIEFYVRNALAGTFNLFGSRYIYAMGGTAKSTLRLHNCMTISAGDGGFISIEKIDKLFRLVDSDPDKMYDIFTRVVKKRADTIVPGIMILRTICDFLDVEGFYVLKCSVRDGYLTKIIE